MEEDKIKSLFSNIFQIGIVVKDMDKAMERLATLGMGPFYQKKISPETQEWFRGEPFEAHGNIMATMLGNMEFELIQPLGGKSPQQEYMDCKGEGIQHIACTVDNLEEALEFLTGKGAEITLRAKRPDGSGIAYVDLGVADITVELVQRKKQ